MTIQRIIFACVSALCLFDFVCGQDGELDRLLFEDDPTEAISPAPSLPSDSPAMDTRSAAQNDLFEKIKQSRRSLSEVMLSRKTVSVQLEILATLRHLQEAAAKTGGGSAESQSKQSQDDVSQGKVNGDDPGSIADGTTVGANEHSESVTSNANESGIRQEHLDRVWGHLPPSVVEKMQAANVTRVPIGYRKQIAEYYRRLSKIPLSGSESK